MQKILAHSVCQERHDKEKVYLKGKDKIVPPFRFGVEDVATKMWFHKLAYPGQCLTNSTESHWILGRLNIEERRVYMYNSLSTAMKDSAAIKACQPFAVLLPHFFALFDEFKKENKPICLDPFEVVKVDGLPQQTSNDCGCFVASFAEYFIDMKPIPPIFDVEKHRDRLAVLFYKYARMKEVEFIDSEDEAPPKDYVHNHRQVVVSIMHDKEKVYLKGKDKIVPPFRFGVEDVATKMWFHKLAYPGQCLTNSHLDIIFYYLRKKGKYAKEPKVKFTTTDCLFFKTIHALYEKFIAQKKNLSLITAQHAIADYIRGRKMLCGSPWHLCDHVFFIIHMETESHWILGRLNIEERRVYMYNSLSTAMKDSAAIKACQPFAVLLPHFFALFDEFKKENKPICLDPFEVVKVDGLPQQTSNDCGCFVASFAEYFIDMKPIPPIFDVEKHRDRLAVLFYKYARMKEVEFIDSEDEAPPKGSKTPSYERCRFVMVLRKRPL
ncbi:hypothetical protein F8388_021352 [Cannabis sativa]|uniref:Ubiquitin-like protease family profile domain-containing protein n=1 Tax=Cannabis sativa TaxID=3483 RepID=A0A7J6GFP2_CANSA|nr:hypothetical protein F8388_021352 [Cannabis sativa]